MSRETKIVVTCDICGQRQTWYDADRIKNEYWSGSGKDICSNCASQIVAARPVATSGPNWFWAHESPPKYKVKSPHQCGKCSGVFMSFDGLDCPKCNPLAGNTVCGGDLQNEQQYDAVWGKGAYKNMMGR